MSFRSSSGDSVRAFERVRRSLLPADGLPFSNVLTAKRLAEVFESGGIDFANADDDPDVVDTPAVTLWAFLSQMLFTGDVVVSDRYDGGWFLIALLQEMGIEVVTRRHQHRTADFRRGRRLGADDHLVAWPKPQRSEWLDQKTYDRLPATLNVREMKFAVRERGFRTQSIVVVSTLRDETTVTREDLADLYRQR